MDFETIENYLNIQIIELGLSEDQAKDYESKYYRGVCKQLTQDIMYYKQHIDSLKEQINQLTKELYD